MKIARPFSSVAVLLIAIFIANIFAVNNVGNANAQENQSFHVGVTFGGDNSVDAKILIDKVKDYTNLFVVASGPLQGNIAELENTCDYAFKSGLDIIVYFGSYEANRDKTTAFIDTARQRWGSHFLGIYYGDEPSGKALDGIMILDNVPNIGNVSVSSHDLTVSQTSDSILTSKSFFYSSVFSGQINVQYDDFAAGNYTTTNYYPNGTIVVSKSWGQYPADSEYLIYLTNGTVLKQTSFPNTNSGSWFLNGTLLEQGPVSTHISFPEVSFLAVTDKGDISQFEPYQRLWDSRPFQTMDDLSAVASSYVKTQQATTDWIANQDYVKLFTSDYVLYWWDYQIGYDTVFAELGWNNTVAQEIGLVRGAANLQNKSWGTIIDWKYNQPPYLPSGDEMYDQMRTSYDCGANYVLVFNYAENMTDPYGTLQDEHFQALQRFWNNVVQNPNVKHGGITAEAALVLPKDYGWGMRYANDTIFGLWKANDTSKQIWNQLQIKLAQYGSKLDIVYDDPVYNVTGKYSQIYYWDRSATAFATPFIIGLLVAAAIIAAVTIIVIRAKRRTANFKVN
jgi:hypothetical protein